LDTQKGAVDLEKIYIRRTGKLIALQETLKKLKKKMNNNIRTPQLIINRF